MNRLCAFLIGAGLVGGIAQAGQIQVGSGTNGLTANYLGATSQTSAGSGLVWTAPGGFGEMNYDTTLFKNTKLGSTAPSPYSGYNIATSTPGPHTVSDGAVNFNMIADGCGAPTTSASTCLGNDYWAAPAAGSSSVLTIPVNVFGVTDVWTILQNQWGLAGAADTMVTFDFGTGPGMVTDSVALTLTNSGANANGAASGQIRDAIDCSTIGNTVSGTNCGMFANGPTAASSSVAATDNAVSIAPITVLSDNVFIAAYNTGGGAGIYGNSKGNVTLTDQGFQFGNAYIGLELLDIKITELNGTNQVSSTGLSAITVDTSATPEPSTLLLLLGGLGIGSAVKFGRRQKA